VSVFDSSGNLVATASASTYGDVATVRLTGLVAGQTYYLQAAGATADVFGMGAYKLTAQFGGFALPPPVAPDRFEANNTPAAATKFGTVTGVSQTGLTLHTSTDVDDYTAAAGSKATYTVSVTPTQGSGTLSLTVLSAQQAVLASGQSQSGGVTLSVSLTSGQPYYVKVWSPTGGAFAYNLSIGKAGGGGGGGAHHLVVGGAANPDDEAQPEGDFFYRSAADDPDTARPALLGPGPGLLPAPADAAAVPDGARTVQPDRPPPPASVSVVGLELGWLAPARRPRREQPAPDEPDPVGEVPARQPDRPAEPGVRGSAVPV